MDFLNTLTNTLTKKLKTMTKIKTGKDIRPWEIHRVVLLNDSDIILDLIDIIAADTHGITGVSYVQSVRVSLAELNDNDKRVFRSRLGRIGNVFWGVYHDDIHQVNFMPSDFWTPKTPLFGVFEHYSGLVEVGRVTVVDSFERYYGVRLRGDGTAIHAPASHFEAVDDVRVLDEIKIIEQQDIELSFAAKEFQQNYLNQCLRRSLS